MRPDAQPTKEPTLAELLDRFTAACDGIQKAAAKCRSTVAEVERINANTRASLTQWKGGTSA